MRVVIAALLLVATACGSGEKVGSSDNLDFEEQGAGRLGGIEITPEPTTVVTDAPAAATAAPKAATAPPTAKPAPAFVVKIIAGGQGFDPFAFKVTKGTRLEIVNTTDREANFRIPGLNVDSGPLGPGAKFEYRAEAPGTHQFEDGTRPFAQGSMEVVG